MGRNYSNKNLTELEIGNIEFYLNEKKSPAEIAKILSKDPSGIRKEIKKYSSYYGKQRKCSNCLNRDNCHQKYLCDSIINKTKCYQCKYCIHAVKICPNYKINIECELLKKNHHVCNGCELYHKCNRVKIKYHAETAIKMHNAVQRISRVDTKADKVPQEFKNYISDRIKKGISPDITLNTLPEKYQMFKISTPTLYSWIDKGLLDCCNLDLRNKVSRIRYGENTLKRNTVKGHQLNGRSIENLPEDERINRKLGIAEFDTVEGIKGGEFTDFKILETSIHESLSKRMEVYYTHTYASYEKPHIENNHILLRWLIKKGFDITLLSSDEILDIINRLNNYPRPQKNYKTPLQLLEEEFGNYILELLNLHHIPITELNMKDMIIKNQERTK